MGLLDEVIPVVSGHNFRKTYENLHTFDYCGCLEKLKEPLSQSFFDSSVLKKQKIQHSKDESNRDLCFELAAQKATVTLKKH